MCILTHTYVCLYTWDRIDPYITVTVLFVTQCLPCVSNINKILIQNTFVTLSLCKLLKKGSVANNHLCWCFLSKHLPLPLTFYNNLKVLRLYNSVLSLVTEQLFAGQGTPIHSNMRDWEAAFAGSESDDGKQQNIAMTIDNLQYSIPFLFFYPKVHCVTGPVLFKPRQFINHSMNGWRK